MTNFPLPSRPGSALRHCEVADYPEVADSADARTCPQKTADIDRDGLRYSPDDLRYGLGPVQTSLSSYVRLVTGCSRTGEGGDWWN